MLAPEQRLRSGGRGQHDVGASNRLVELLERQCLSAKGFRQLHSAFVGPVRKKNVLGASRNQVAGRQFGHLARAYDIHSPVSQRAENLFCQLHGNSRNRNTRAADGRLRAYPLGHRKRPRKQGLQSRMHCAQAARHGVSFFDLSQDLRLAHDHRIQAGGHTKNMPHSLALPELIDMGMQCIGAYAEVAAQELAQVGSLAAAGEQLDPVAGGEHHAFIHSWLLHQGANGIGQSCLRDGQPLPHIERCAVVVHANELKIHHAIKLCFAKNTMGECWPPRLPQQQQTHRQPGKQRGVRASPHSSAYTTRWSKQSTSVLKAVP